MEYGGNLFAIFCLIPTLLLIGMILIIRWGIKNRKSNHGFWIFFPIAVFFIVSIRIILSIYQELI